MNKIIFIILNARQTMSEERKASGAIKTKHIHTPTAHGMLRSLEDLLLMTLTISGILNKGKTIAAMNDIVFIKKISRPSMSVSY
ncbi:MAG: hypothetical protein NTY34_07665 [Candidatus Omnitrophica bacterium]|nr:hypothetical protein [Candidatus Omnitrophota bacterium]